MNKRFVLPLLVVGLVALNVSAEEPAVAEKKLDFGDESSSTLTTKAWESLTAKKFDDTITFAKKCISMYEKDALAMQAELTEPVAGDKEEVLSKWALNDVGTCYFILGQAYEKQEKGSEALKTYRLGVKKLSFAQCWDPQGWFWKPADAAKKQIKMLEFDEIDNEAKE
jgi:hypothetical protein